MRSYTCSSSVHACTVAWSHRIQSWSSLEKFHFQSNIHNEHREQKDHKNVLALTESVKLNNENASIIISLCLLIYAFMSSNKIISLGLICIWGCDWVAFHTRLWIILQRERRSWRYDEKARAVPFNPNPTSSLHQSVRLFLWWWRRGCVFF